MNDDADSAPNNISLHPNTAAIFYAKQKVSDRQDRFSVPNRLFYAKSPYTEYHVSYSI